MKGAVLARQWTDNCQGTAKRRSELAILPPFPFGSSTANSAQDLAVLIPIHHRQKRLYSLLIGLDHLTPWYPYISGAILPLMYTICFTSWRL